MNTIAGYIGGQMIKIHFSVKNFYFCNTTDSLKL